MEPNAHRTSRPRFLWNVLGLRGHLLDGDIDAAILA